MPTLTQSSAPTFAIGATVKVIQAVDGLDYDLGRVGEVLAPSSNPELAGQVRVLLDGDQAARRFQPSQLEMVDQTPTVNQQAVLAEWKARGWTVIALGHELCAEAEIYLEATKGTGVRGLFVAPDGSVQTEPQRQKILELQAEGWDVTVLGKTDHSLELHLRLKARRNLRLKARREEEVLLSIAGYTASLPMMPAIDKDSELQQLEKALRALNVAENAAVKAGGFSWTPEWKGVGIYDYGVQKKLKSGAIAKYYYHRLEATRPIFPHRRQSKNGLTHTKKLHLSNQEFARYRAAKYRYDQRQKLLEQIEKTERKLRRKKR